MYLMSIFMLATTPLLTTNYYEEGKRIAEETLKNEQTTSNTDKEYLKKILAEVKDSHHEYNSRSPNENEKRGKCITGSPIINDPQSPLYIFVSFSMSDTTWLSLSKEAEGIGGILVLRGLPENSFKQLAVKMHNLRKQGLRATVQIDPRLFVKYNIDKVPCFVTTEEERFDKLSGNVSLAFALDKMETQTAKQLRALL
jgi:type-F conjugative transfer system pilin assembly protein TrbC